MSASQGNAAGLGPTAGTNPLHVLVPGTNHKAFVVAAVREQDGPSAASAYFELTEDQVRWAAEYRHEHAAAFQFAFQVKEFAQSCRRPDKLSALCDSLDKVIQYWIPDSDEMTLDHHLLIVANEELRQELAGETISDEAIEWAVEVIVYAPILAPDKKDRQRDGDEFVSEIRTFNLVPRIHAGVTAIVQHCAREQDETLPSDLLQTTEKLVSFLDDGFGSELAIIPLVNVLRYARKSRINVWQAHFDSETKQLSARYRKLSRLRDGLGQMLEYMRIHHRTWLLVTRFEERTEELLSELRTGNVSDEVIQRAETAVESGRDMGIINQVVDDD